MAINRINGLPGIVQGRFSSQGVRTDNGGKFTDYSMLTTLQRRNPSAYDKDLINLYSQTGLYRNDFLDLINQSTPYEVDGGADSFYYNVALPYENNVITDIPASTYALDSIGIDGHEFDLVVKYKVAKNDILALGSYSKGAQIFVTVDPKPVLGGWLITATSASNEVISKKWLSIGVPVGKVGNAIGEFDQDYSGIGRLGEKITLYHTLGSEQGVEHTITGWADDVRFDGQVDKLGRPKDLLVYLQGRPGEMPTSKQFMMWEPYVEFALRKELLSMRVKKFLWARGGVVRTNGSRQNEKLISTGVYHGIKKYGNYYSFNKGEFGPQILRDALGDLFYQRKDVKDRYAKMYTNTAGMLLWKQMLKDDALGSGLSLTANVDAIHTGDVNASSPSNNLVYSWSFSKMYSTETGLVEVVHLSELDNDDLSGTTYAGRYKDPIFLILDVSNSSNGSLKDNIREVRMKGRPNMIWGYMDGLRHHNGAFASQGHSMGHKADSYTVIMKERVDPFVEDFSKMVLIEQNSDFSF
jgi:hypothetical protein